MKNKLLALLIFSVTLLGLAFYLLTEFEDELTTTTSTQTAMTDASVSLEPVLENSVKTEKVTETTADGSTRFFVAGVDYILQQELDKLQLLNQDQQSLWLFPYEEEQILQKIYGNTDFLVLRLGTTYYILDPQSGVKHSFSLAFSPKYVKKNKDTFLVVTEKGVFSYNRASNDVVFEHIFSDFLVYDSSTYIGYIAVDDREKQQYFWLQPLKKNVIVAYYTQEKKLEVLKTVNQDIQKIYEAGKSIYFETEDKQLFRLRNF